MTIEQKIEALLRGERLTTPGHDFIFMHLDNGVHDDVVLTDQFTELSDRSLLGILLHPKCVVYGDEDKEPELQEDVMSEQKIKNKIAKDLKEIINKHSTVEYPTGTIITSGKEMVSEIRGYARALKD